MTALLHGLFWLAVCGAVAMSLAWIEGRSRFLALVAVAGVLARLTAGTTLFAISYYHWPILQSLQAGNGFWALAPDAAVYYRMAATAAEAGRLFEAVSRQSASPAYVFFLSLWLRATGLSVLSAVLFNVACYVASVVALVQMTRKRDQASVALAVLAVSFSPALILCSAQVLKDTFFVFLIVLVCASSRGICRNLPEGWTRRRFPLAGATVLAALAIGTIGGVRAYFALFAWGSLALACSVVTCVSSVARRISLVALALTVLMVLWGAFMVGAGPYYPFYRNLIGKALHLQVPDTAASEGSFVPGDENREAVVATLFWLRRGFVNSRGGTNLDQPDAAGAARPSVLRELADLGIGLAATFIPISVLQAASVVQFEGGRGFLALTDIDTLFLDISLAAVAIILIRRRAELIGALPELVFFVALTVVCALAIAYVVTNFGTLFRLRLLIAVPLWMWPIVLGSPFDSGRPEAS